MSSNPDITLELYIKADFPIPFSFQPPASTAFSQKNIHKPKN